MNRSDLIDEVAKRLDTTRKDAERALDAVVDVIQRGINQGEKVRVKGLGVFESVERAARTVRNPATGELVDKARTRVPRFRAGTDLKEILAGLRELPAEVISGDEKGARAAVRKITGQPEKKASTPAAAAAVKAPAAKAAAPATKAPAKKAPAAKAPAKKAPAKKAAAKKAPAKEAPAPAPEKAQARRRTASEASPAAPTPMMASPAKKAPAKKAPAKKAPAKKAPAKKAPATKAPAKKAPDTKAPAPEAGGSASS